MTPRERMAPLVLTLLGGVAIWLAIRAFLSILPPTNLTLYLRLLAFTGALGGIISGLIETQGKLLLCRYSKDGNGFECGAIADMLIGIGGSWGVFLVLSRFIRPDTAEGSELTGYMLSVVALGVVAGFSSRALLGSLRGTLLGMAQSAAQSTAERVVKETMPGEVRSTAEKVSDSGNVRALLEVADTMPPGPERDVRLASAEAIAQESLQRHPDNATLLIFMGAIRKRQAVAAPADKKDELLRQAIELCTRAAALEPANWVAYYNRACYRALRNEPVGPILEDIDAAIRLNPDAKRRLPGDPDMAQAKRDHPEILARLTA